MSAAQNGADDDQNRLDHQAPSHTPHHPSAQQMQQNLQTQQNHQPHSYQVDVRMKRHPELQPYIPSDRDRFSGTKTNSKPVRKTRTNMLGVSNPNDAKTSATKSKKCVSMSRLDQLAQPKRVFTRKPIQVTSTGPSSSLTSSNAASTTTNSSVTSTRNYQRPKPVPSQKQAAWDETIDRDDRQQNLSNVADQLSEMSMDDQHYQSAASDLLQESKNSTNGMSFHRNLGSLCQDLDADLIEAGIMKPDMSKTIEVVTPQPQNDKDDRDDDDRWRKNEEELEREAQRLQLEREQRKSLLEDIMVRVRKDSPRANNEPAFSN